MTAGMLVSMGGVWCAILFLCARYFSGKFKLQRHRSFATGLLWGMGLGALGHEYWLFLDHRAYCRASAGWTLLQPVATDRLLVDVPDYTAYQVVLSNRIGAVEIETSLNGWRSSYPDDYWAEIEAEADDKCQAKWVKFRDHAWMYGAHWAQSYLIKDGFCLKQGSFEPPRFRLKVNSTPAWWSYRSEFLRNTRYHTDQVFQIIEEPSGLVLSEYRRASSPAGFFPRFIRGWWIARYACDETGFVRGLKWSGLEQDIALFLDTALLPVE